MKKRELTRKKTQKSIEVINFTNKKVEKTFANTIGRSFSTDDNIARDTFRVNMFQALNKDDKKRLQTDSRFEEMFNQFLEESYQNYIKDLKLIAYRNHAGYVRDQLRNQKLKEYAKKFANREFYVTPTGMLSLADFTRELMFLLNKKLVEKCLDSRAYNDYFKKETKSLYIKGFSLSKSAEQFNNNTVNKVN